MKKLVFCIVFVLLAVSACDIKLSSTISVSDLLSPTNKIVLSDLMFEVSSCSETDLQKVIEEINRKNISAKYNKCQSDGFSDYAVFSIPLTIVKNKDGIQKENVVYLSVNDKKVYLHTSSAIDWLLLSDEGKSKIKEISFNLVNDTEQPLKVNLQYVFVDGKPILSQAIELAQYSKTNIQLSDVAVKQVETPNTTFQIMEFE